MSSKQSNLEETNHHHFIPIPFQSIYSLLLSLFVYLFDSYSPNQIEIEEDSVRMNVGVGGSSPHSHISGFEVVNGEYDYTTALTVTLTVGICLILLNLVVFSAIMCHRKRGLASETLSMSTTGSPGSRHGGPGGGGGGTGNSGTPLKSPYKVLYGSIYLLLLVLYVIEICSLFD